MVDTRTRRMVDWRTRRVVEKRTRRMGVFMGIDGNPYLREGKQKKISVFFVGLTTKVRVITSPLDLSVSYLLPYW